MKFVLNLEPFDGEQYPSLNRIESVRENFADAIRTAKGRLSEWTPLYTPKGLEISVSVELPSGWDSDATKEFVVEMWSGAGGSRAKVLGKAR